MKTKHLLKILIILIQSVIVTGQTSWNLISTEGNTMEITSVNTAYYFKNIEFDGVYPKCRMAPTCDNEIEKSIDYLNTFMKAYSFYPGSHENGYNLIDKIFFCNDSIGFIVNKNLGTFSSCYKTINGGKNWIEIDVTYGMNGLASVTMFFVNQSLGYFYNADQINNLFKYENNVTTLIYTPQKYIFSNNSCALYFLNDSIGFMLVGDTSKRNCIIKTNNKGTIWNEIYVSKNKINDIKFISDSVGYAVCDSGIILKTINTGDTWTKLKIGTQDKLNSISHLNDTIVVAGDKGSIYYCINNGELWQKINFLNSNNLTTVKCFSGFKIYVIDTIGNVFSNFLTTNVKQIKENDIRIYPNPSSDIIKINIPAVSNNLEVNIYNLQGELIKHKANEQIINITDLKEGMYIVELFYDRQSIKQKLIKK
jgi:hypothetical protein